MWRTLRRGFRFRLLPAIPQGGARVLPCAKCRSECGVTLDAWLSSGAVTLGPGLGRSHLGERRRPDGSRWPSRSRTRRHVSPAARWVCRADLTLRPGCDRPHSRTHGVHPAPGNERSASYVPIGRRGGSRRRRDGASGSVPARWRRPIAPTRTRTGSPTRRDAKRRFRGRAAARQCHRTSRTTRP